MKILFHTMIGITKEQFKIYKLYDTISLRNMNPLTKLVSSHRNF